MDVDVSVDQSGLTCPRCGNRGESDGAWQLNDTSPFRLLEDFTRSWPFTVRRGSDVALIAVADASRDRIEWEGGTNRRFGCMQCLAEIAMTDDWSVAFE